MSIKYVLVVFLLCPFATLDENGMQQWDDFPSMQLPTSSKTISFEITIQTIQYACKTLHNKMDKGKPSNFSIGRTDLDIQIKSGMDIAYITWNVQYDKRCQRRMYMLDAEYRIENSRTTVCTWCVQYNLPKGESSQKEILTFDFDCIRTVPDGEEHLIVMAVWFLPPNWSTSLRTLRSANSDCCRILCSSLLRTETYGSGDKRKGKKMCQCWRNLNISLELISDTTDIRFMQRAYECHGRRLSTECERDPQNKDVPSIMRPARIFATSITEFIPFTIIMIVSAGTIAVVTIVLRPKAWKTKHLLPHVYNRHGNGTPTKKDEMKICKGTTWNTRPLLSHVENLHGIGTPSEKEEMTIPKIPYKSPEYTLQNSTSAVIVIDNVVNLTQQISTERNLETDCGPSLFKTCLRM